MKAVRRSEIVEVCPTEEADPEEWGIVDGYVRDRYGNPLPVIPGSFLVRDSFGVTVINADTYARCFAEVGTSELSFATDAELRNELFSRYDIAIFSYVKDAPTGDAHQVSGFWYHGGWYASWGLLLAKYLQFKRQIVEKECEDEP